MFPWTGHACTTQIVRRQIIHHLRKVQLESCQQFKQLRNCEHTIEGRLKLRENKAALAISYQYNFFTAGCNHHGMAENLGVLNMPIVALGKLLQRAGSSHRSCHRATLMVAQEQAGHYCQHLHTIENATSIIYYRGREERASSRLVLRTINSHPKRLKIPGRSWSVLPLA